jgi:hypothetical protein
MASAETKLKRSWKSFPDEWAKIEYLRGYCKDAAYNAIRLRALPQSNNKYEHRQDLYDELEELFGVQDKQKVALNKIIHGKIKQADSESVGAWLSRFSNVAIEAGLDTKTKHSFALTNLNSRYKSPAVNNAGHDESWAAFISRMRAVEFNNAAAYGTERRNRDTRGGGKRDTKKDASKPGSRSQNDEYGSWRPKEEFAKIMAKKVCAKCFKSGHRPTDKDAPCRRQKKKPFSAFEDLAAANKEELKE